MTAGVLCATDLDRTLIYSRRAAGSDPPELVAVERYKGADISWMAASAAARFRDLQRRTLVVPVTTRTPEQWRRVRLPGPPAPYAVTANGGVLLVDGQVDSAWGATVAALLSRVAPLAEIWTQATRMCHPEWVAKLRKVGNLFCYAVLHPRRLPAGFLAEAGGWAGRRGWRLSLQGRKLYWVPRPLTKSAAVAEVARRTGASTVLAAGDSRLDADLLATADRAILARHGELAASGWSAPSVTVTEQCGALAGAEIVDWFAASLECAGS